MPPGTPEWVLCPLTKSVMKDPVVMQVIMAVLLHGTSSLVFDAACSLPGSSTQPHSCRGLTPGVAKLQDGNTYERAAILRWLDEHGTSPTVSAGCGCRRSPMVPVCAASQSVY